MLYMFVVKTKEGAAPEDFAAMLKKFQSWEPPDGLTVEGNWTRGGGRFYSLIKTDDPTLVVEVTAQFSKVLDFHVDPIVPVEDALPAMLRGAEWAAS